MGQWAWEVCEFTHFKMQWRWKAWLHTPQTARKGWWVKHISSNSISLHNIRQSILSPNISIKNNNWHPVMKRKKVNSPTNTKYGLHTPKFSFLPSELCCIYIARQTNNKRKQCNILPCWQRAEKKKASSWFMLRHVIMIWRWHKKYMQMMVIYTSFALNFTYSHKHKLPAISKLC